MENFMFFISYFISDNIIDLHLCQTWKKSFLVWFRRQIFDVKVFFQNFREIFWYEFF